MTVNVSVPTAPACPLRFYHGHKSTSAQTSFRSVSYTGGACSSANFQKKSTFQSGSSDHANPPGVEVDACANLIFYNASIRRHIGISIILKIHYLE